MPKATEVGSSELLKSIAANQAAILDLQKLMASPDVQAVRSCTSCLSDSCKQPQELAGATPQPG